MLAVEEKSGWLAWLKDKLPWRWMLVGGVLVLLLLWFDWTPAGLLGKADAVGYAVCHRIEARSFHIGERQFSFCARCSGQYLGALLGFVYLSLIGRRRVGRPPLWIILVLAIFAAAYAFDGFNSYLHLIPGTDRFQVYEPSNILRLITGTGLGMALSVALLPAFHQTVWARIDPRPTLANFKALAGLLLLASGLVVLVLTEQPLVLYPLAILSAASVLILLTLVYTMVWVLLFRMENRFNRGRELVWPLVAGFGLALTQIVVLNLLRFWLTGTWEGFHFG